MRCTKHNTFIDFKSLLTLTLIVLVSTLSACSQKSSQNEVTISDDTLSAPLPSTLLTVDETTLVVEVVIDDSSPQTCANLSVNKDSGTYKCNINLSGGTHTISLVFSIIDTTHGKVQVASATGVSVNVSPGQTTSADFSTVPIIYNDNDNDGINNLNELNEGSDPNASSYYVGGTISGLSGIGIVIQLNGGKDLTLTSNDNFNFIPAIADTSNYTVTVLTQPDSQNQTCTVSNENGIVSGASITDVTITCTEDQVAPSVINIFDDPIIDVSSTIIIEFDESIQKSSLIFSGGLGDRASASWSQGLVADDTLTISAKVEWPIDTAQSLIIDATDLAGNSLSRLTLEFDVSVIHVSTDATNANDSNIGTRDRPLKTIVAAVNLANSTLSKSEIRVALGNYTTFSEGGTNIVVSDGMRLMGGYSADWLLRNRDRYQTFVNDTSTTTVSDFSNPNCVITISAGAGSETLVDGFMLTGAGGNFESCGIEIEANASPTIENNIISGGRGASSTGIIDRGLNPVIRNNTIRGSESGADSRGVTGISSGGSSPTIINNVINGGRGVYSCIGISLTDVNAIVEKNSVVGCSATDTAGVSISSTSTILLRNNTIHGGYSQQSDGIWIGKGNTITLQNNTIYGGGEEGNFSTALSIGSPAIIENNILFGFMCIRETDINADPISLSANNLYGCEQRFFYLDFDAQCTGNADGDNDAKTCTLAEMNQLTGGSNMNEDLGFGTQPDADWHLDLDSAPPVKFNGLDLSFAFSTDKDGIQRTEPWSIGAYEQDNTSRGARDAPF